MTKLAEAYLHIKGIRPTKAELTELGDVASVLAAEVGRDFFSDDSIIEIRLSEGSLKTWITVIGVGAFPIYGGIADYKGFKESVSEIVSDSQKFSQLVLEKFVKRGNLSHSEIFRRERRTKTPGRIRRLLARREWLEEHRNQLSRNHYHAEELEIERLLQDILKDIQPSDRSKIRDLLGEQTPPVPLPEAPKVPAPVSRDYQLEMPYIDQQTTSEPVPDYMQRFRLSDGPKRNISLYKQGDAPKFRAPPLLGRAGD